jgi:putative ABC transport system permease protein
MIAIVIACIGLYGLSSLIITQRTKEIGIRKVHGFSATNIIYIISSDFIKLIVIANVIAWPTVYVSMNSRLQDYAFRISLNGWFFIASGLSVTTIALLTITYQILKAAHTNPIMALRYE